MIVTDYAIRSRTTVYVLSAAIVVFGIFSYYALPREAAPDITIPFIVVNTAYSGVSPADMETSVTLEIEKKLKGMSDVKEIRSVSSEGFSSITVEFEPDIEIDTALQKVRDKVDQARGEIPQESDEPTVTEINISEFPIMLINVTGEVGVVRLKEIADDIQDDIEAVQGVLAANVIGALEREIRVEVDPDRLAQYRIPVLQLISLISQENVNVSGGSVETPGAKFAVRVPAEFDDPREIRVARGHGARRQAHLPHRRREDNGHVQGPLELLAPQRPRGGVAFGPEARRRKRHPHRRQDKGDTGRMARARAGRSGARGQLRRVAKTSR